MTSFIQDAIAAAHGSASPLRITGSGTWLNAGRPVAATTHASTRELSGVVEYIPGDLVITVNAGTTLGDLAQITAEHNQWCPLQPYSAFTDSSTNSNADVGTIGATIATASQGPLALGYGRARDLILGLQCVTGNGDVMRAGGRVVKNVAGFDLVRLLTGSWGTLGVITEISLRLHALPAVDTTFAIALDVPDDDATGDSQLAGIIEQLNSAPLLAATISLASCVILSSPAATAIGAVTGVPRAPYVLLARAMGNRTRVEAQRNALAALGEVVAVDSNVWQHVRTLDAGNTTVRFAGAPMRTANTMRLVRNWLDTVAARDMRMVVEPMRGGVRVSCNLPEQCGHGVALPTGMVAERLPVDWWSAVPSSVGDRISSQLLYTFDAAGILNPGILGAVAVPAPVTFRAPAPGIT